jgi:alginate O-acetyltransferase complex protein AlgI
MLFNSFQYLFFFVTIIISYYLLPRKYRWMLLLAGSYFFYMSWKPMYILLIVFSTLVDYTVGLKMAKTDNRKLRVRYLVTSLVVNLGLLFVFKYFNFFNSSVIDFLNSLGIEANPVKLDVLLPVGISFYTFQTLSYTIDIYNKKIKPEKHFGKFALYVSFFPQLVAGPIERASNLLPQFKVFKNATRKDFIAGFSQVIFGLFKKIVVADTAAIYVNSIYQYPEINNGLTLTIATYAFAFQIYCDFSGYSDIAIGSARMLGYDLMDNFKLPYFSKNITEFWRRWHISLSSWLKDYLYIPLGGNRKGNIFTYRNLMITMLLGGLWHGASWNFVIWGGINGLALALEKFTGVRNIDRIANKNIISKGAFAFLTFNIIALTWVFFRAETLKKATDILSIIGTNFWTGGLAIKDTRVFMNLIIGIGFLFVLEYFFLRKRNFNNFILEKKLPFIIIFNTILIIIMVLMGVSEGSQFIYFQF